MRFKGDVPALVLIPHVVTMFVSMMIGIRAALAAVLGRPESRRYAWVAVVGIAIGGLVLGPIVQKCAFGAYWTGWPFGSDLTDNKTLGMWLAWVAAVVVLGWRGSGRSRRAVDDRRRRARDDRGLPRPPQPAGQPARLRPARGRRGRDRRGHDRA